MDDGERQKRLVDAALAMTKAAIAARQSGRSTGKFQVTYVTVAGELKEVSVNDITTLRPEDF